MKNTFICRHCHLPRNVAKASVTSKYGDFIGYLCHKCSCKEIQSVKNRPAGMSWRKAVSEFFDSLNKAQGLKPVSE